MSELKSILIIAVVACIFITSSSLYIGSTYQGYENVDNISYFDETAAISEQVQGMKERIEPSGNQLVDALSYMLTSSYNAIIMVFAVVPIFNSIGFAIGGIFGVPAAIINLVMLILFIIILIDIVYILTGRTGS